MHSAGSNRPPPRIRPQLKALRARRDQLLNYMADLDHRLEIESMDQRDHARMREQAKRS